jgi:hypothetical protein
MSNERTTRRDQLDDLLAWLDPDRDRAGAKYERLRRGLVMSFTVRGCSDADKMADETINRVMTKLIEIKPAFGGDLALYVDAVAKHVMIEHSRMKQSQVPSEEVSNKLSNKDSSLPNTTGDLIEHLTMQGNQELIGGSLEDVDIIAILATESERLSKATAKILQDVTRAYEKIRKDQQEIEQLKTETREMLARLRAA